MAYVTSSGPASSEKEPSALGLLLVVGSLLGTSAIFAKAAPEFGWSPIVLLQWSLAGSALLQGLFMVWQSSWAEIKRAVTGRSSSLLIYMMIAGLLFALPNALAFAAAPNVGAGFIALCLAFPLVLTYGLSVVMKLERFSALRGLGVLFGLIGGVLLVGGGQSLDPEARVWVLAALAAPMIIAGANIYRTLKWPAGASPLLLSVGMMVFGFVSLVVLTHSLGLPQLPQVVTSQSFGLVALQAFIFAVQYVAYFRLQKVAGPVYLSQIGSVGAVTGLVLAFLFFQEVPGLLQLAAVISVGLGIFFVSYRR